LLCTSELLFQYFSPIIKFLVTTNLLLKKLCVDRGQTYFEVVDIHRQIPKCIGEVSNASHRRKA